MRSDYDTLILRHRHFDSELLNGFAERENAVEIVDVGNPSSILGCRFDRVILFGFDEAHPISNEIRTALIASTASAHVEGRLVVLLGTSLNQVMKFVGKPAMQTVALAA